MKKIFCLCFLGFLLPACDQESVLPLENAKALPGDGAAGMVYTFTNVLDDYKISFSHNNAFRRGIGTDAPTL